MTWMETSCNLIQTSQNYITVTNSDLSESETIIIVYKFSKKHVFFSIYVEENGITCE